MNARAVQASCGWVLALAAQPLVAQTPIDVTTKSAVEAVIGNQVLQLRYLGQSPFSGIGSNLDYGALLTENREFIGSAALMFDTDIVPLSRLRLQVGPELSLAWLETGRKTQVAALSVGASVRYEILHRFGLSALGSAFYSPGVLTFGNAHNMYDFTAGAEARLGGRLYVLGGYRWLKFTLVDEPDEKVANELFAGVRWQLD
jgi:YfaZ precursor